MLPALLAFHLFITAIRASSVESTFRTTCTVPNTTTHYVSSPDTRGTLDILWSSLFTIIACTLTVQHLNVPEQREERDPGWRGDLKWRLKDTWKSLKWMLITILAPELLIAISWHDLIIAWRTHGKLRQFAEEDEVPWTMTHTLLANMGGFVIRSQQDKRTESRLKGGDSKPDDSDAIAAIVPTVLARNPAKASIELTDHAEVTSTACDLPRMSDEREFSSNGAEVASEPLPNPCHVTAEDIFILRQSEHLKKLPHITEDEINDRSKSNSFVKAIAVTQILWMVVQIIVRTSRGLAITQLEIAVMAFSVCAVILYIFNWRKPKGIKTTFPLAIFSGDIPDAIERQIRVGYDNCWRLSHGFLPDSAFRNQRAGNPIRNDNGDDWSLLSLGLFFGCSIFGGIHIAAWTFHFPSRVELILWRVASIWCTVFALVTTLLASIMGIVEVFFVFDDDDRLVNGFGRIFLALYVICRFILLVEIFRTLLFLPPDAFIATSASNIPHLA